MWCVPRFLWWQRGPQGGWSWEQEQHPRVPSQKGLVLILSSQVGMAGSFPASQPGGDAAMGTPAAESILFVPQGDPTSGVSQVEAQSIYTAPVPCTHPAEGVNPGKTHPNVPSSSRWLCVRQHTSTKPSHNATPARPPPA